MRTANSICRSSQDVFQFVRLAVAMSRRIGSVRFDFLDGSSHRFLFLLAWPECRLPTRCRALLTRRCSNCFDLFFFRLLRFSIAFLFTLSHAALLGLLAG